MPIAPEILQRLENNDTKLTYLNFNRRSDFDGEPLDDSDIEVLIHCTSRLGALSSQIKE